MEKKIIGSLNDLADILHFDLYSGSCDPAFMRAINSQKMSCS